MRHPLVSLGSLCQGHYRATRRGIRRTCFRRQAEPGWGINTVSNELLHNLIPGPVTVVLQRTKLLNSQLNPNTDLVGIRIPDHDFIRQVVSKLGEPLALTSANISISQSTLCIQEFQVLWPKLDLIFDGGVLSNCEESRLGST
ncbi:threonylcarbamoyl-AMP synthase-like, partial [Saccoglossus kowalevskii]